MVADLVALVFHTSNAMRIPTLGRNWEKLEIHESCELYIFLKSLNPSLEGKGRISSVGSKSPTIGELNLENHIEYFVWNRLPKNGGYFYFGAKMFLSRHQYSPNNYIQ